MRIKWNAPIVLTFTLLTVAVYGLDVLMFNKLTPLLAVYPGLLSFDFWKIASLITYVFAHGGLDHLIGNLTFILLLGPIIEEKYGSNNLLMMILATALITGLINVFFFNTGLIGASGIVFMMILLVSFTNVKSGEVPITFILVAFLFFGKEIYQSMQDNNISETAHIIGGICGSIFGFQLRSRN